MSTFTFNDDNIAKFEKLKLRYPKIDSLTLPSLWMAQYQEGYISNDAIIYIAKLLNMSAAQIYAIASFYTMFRFKPVGRHHIQICRSISCKLCGKDEILKHLKDNYDLQPGQTSKDGKITLSVVECLGACGGAPMMDLNETYYENISIKKLDAILESLK